MTRLTSFIDLQQKLLYNVVCGWEDDFTGYVIGYGFIMRVDLGHEFASN